MKTKFDTFCKKYIRRFNYDGKTTRQIGVEKEILVTDKDGFMADITENVWPHIEDKRLQTDVDPNNSDNINGFFFKKHLITTDFGKGTFELVLSPQKSIAAAEENIKKLLRVLYPVCQKQNLRILSLGFQPRTRADEKSVVDKQRYELLVNSFKKKVLPSSLTASDQVHVDVTVDEFVPALNTLTGLAGFMMILFSNSPVRYGRQTGSNVLREFFRHYLGKNRTGIPPTPYKSIEDYLARVWEMKCFMAQRKNKKFYAPMKKFKDYVRRLPDKEIFDKFCIHEGTIYNCARPRFYGTIEVRPACLQPWNDMMVVPAFVLGLVENLAESSAFVNDFKWETLRDMRDQAAENGFETKIHGKKVALYLKDLLDISKKGLLKKKQGGEAYLKPLYERVEEEKSPADRAIEWFNEGGLPLLLTNAELKAKHIKLPRKHGTIQNKKGSTRSSGAINERPSKVSVARR
ncbi:glutamate-cysteine ligase family protein [Pseudomonadota bacterium]